MNVRRSAALIGTVALCLAAATTGAQSVVGADVYERAAKFIFVNRSSYVLNSDVSTHWRSGAHERLTYLKELGEGHAEFVQIDAATGKRSAAFDQEAVATGLTGALGKPVESNKLPFKDYDELPGAVRFDLEDKTWTCSTGTPGCTSTAAPKSDPKEVASPDGKWVAYTQDYNLWVRSTDGGTGQGAIKSRERYPTPPRRATGPVSSPPAGRR